MNIPDLISSQDKVQGVNGMQVQQQEAYYNFVNSIDSDATKKIYEYCMSKFLEHYDIDLDALLKLPQQDISNLIIKYLVDKKISRQYKNIIVAMALVMTFFMDLLEQTHLSVVLAMI